LLRVQGKLLQQAEVGRFIPRAVDVLHNPIELLWGKNFRVVAAVKDHADFFLGTAVQFFAAQDRGLAGLLLDQAQRCVDRRTFSSNKRSKNLIDFLLPICYPYSIIISRRAASVSIPLGHRRNGQQAFIFLNEVRGLKLCFVKCAVKSKNFLWKKALQY
ncbi:MAG: hypothetical protein K1W21_10125, partial [Oscillospiraceae bacterium]